MSRYLQGDDELRQKLRSLTSKDAKAALRKGTRAGAKIVAAEDKDAVPNLSGNLRASVKVRALKRSRRWVGHAVVLNAISKRGVPYSAFVNYGTRRIRASRVLNTMAKRAAARALAAVSAAAKAEVERRACRAGL